MALDRELDEPVAKRSGSRPRWPRTASRTRSSPVKPGIVLISFTSTSPSSRTKKSQRARPVPAIASNTRAASSRTRATAAGPIGAGTTSSIPPSAYLASKSYQSEALVTIAPGSEVSTLERSPIPVLPITEHSTSRPPASASTITRGSWASASSTASVELGLGIRDPRDPDARSEPRGLHPQRLRHRRRVLAPARLADLAELDLGQVPEGEQALADELVHRHRRGEHARSGVGDVERLEQSLDGAVLAERAVQHGEGDVAAEQPSGGAQLDLLARRRASGRRARSAPRPPRGRRRAARRRPRRPSAARRRARRSARRRSPRSCEA